MNAKLLLLLMLVLNFIILMFSAACSQSTECSFSGDGNVLSTFFNFDNNLLLNPNANQQLSLTDGLTQSIESANQGQTGTASSTTSGVALFLDSLKMILAFISLITPLPIFYMISVLGFPFWADLLLGIIFGLMYAVGIMEFIGGRRLS